MAMAQSNFHVGGGEGKSARPVVQMSRDWKQLSFNEVGRCRKSGRKEKGLARSCAEVHKVENLRRKEIETSFQRRNGRDDGRDGERGVGGS